jgi:hypothetical protein
MAKLKFLPGVIIIQLATVTLILAVVGDSSGKLWLPLACMGLTITGFATLWFGAIADNISKDVQKESTLKHAREREKLASLYAREREQILVAAEAEKLNALEKSHERVMRETGKAHSKANIRLGLGLLGLASIGGIMLAIEFMTLGLLIFTTCGGVLSGYLIRAKQEKTRIIRDDGSSKIPYDSHQNRITFRPKE